MWFRIQTDLRDVVRRHPTLTPSQQSTVGSEFPTINGVIFNYIIFSMQLYIQLCQTPTLIWSPHETSPLICVCS